MILFSFYMAPFFLILLFLFVVIFILLFPFGIYLIYSAKNIPVLILCTLAIFVLVSLWNIKNFSFLKSKLALVIQIVLLLMVIVAVGSSLKLDKKALLDIKTKSKQIFDIVSIFHKGVPIIDVRRIDNSGQISLRPITGQLWSPDNDESIFWFDGLTWNLIKDDNKKYIGPILIKVRFNPRSGEVEPLISTGVARSGDSLYMKYLSGNEAQICYDHWGVHGFPSETFRIDPNNVYLIEVSLGSFYPGINLGELSKNVIIKVDGKIVLNKEGGFHPTTFEQIVLGKNVVECSVCGREFTGQIIEAGRLGEKFYGTARLDKAGEESHAGRFI